jgi:hypothetical protein
MHLALNTVYSGLRVLNNAICRILNVTTIYEKEQYTHVAIRNSKHGSSLCVHNIKDNI